MPRSRVEVPLTRQCHDVEQRRSRARTSVLFKDAAFELFTNNTKLANMRYEEMFDITALFFPPEYAGDAGIC